MTDLRGPTIDQPTNRVEDYVGALIHSLQPTRVVRGLAIALLGDARDQRAGHNCKKNQRGPRAGNSMIWNVEWGNSRVAPWMP